MKRASRYLAAVFMLGVALAPPLCAEEPIIPPAVYGVRPAGMERGATVTFILDGRNLSGADAVLFDAPGITGKVTQVVDVSETAAVARAGVDLGAIVARGKKQTANVEITAAKDVEPGIHSFRIHTPLGTSNIAVFAVGALPEMKAMRQSAADSAARPQAVTLPATLVGTIAQPGDTDTFQFDGQAGEELVFRVLASPLGSKLQSLLILRGAAGEELAQAGENEDSADAVLISKLPHDGKYVLSITDRERGGGSDHFYRLEAGPLAYVTGVFPLGVRAGRAASVQVSGVNLGDVRDVEIDPPKSADGWTTVPLEVKGKWGVALNKVKLAVGDDPEILEREPNNTPAQAQAVSVPVTVNGHIDGGVKASGTADEDYFRFHARQGERLDIEVAAARLGSPLDSVLEVLDAEGRAIPRATVRCLTETTTTLSDRDSRGDGIRLVSTTGIHEGDYLMVGDELDRVAFVPDQPDADVILKSVSGMRQAYLGTSPDAHAVNTPVYKAQILPPGAKMPDNGLPVFHLTLRNDDGGPGYGADSRLDFVAPQDGDYLVHLKDVRGLEGPDFAYRLSIRDSVPDYQLVARPANPNIPKGGSLPVEVSASRLGYNGPIRIDVGGLPHGVTASAATIPAGQDSTVVIFSAAGDAPTDSRPVSFKVVGHANANGRDLLRVANNGAPLQVASVIPPPDVVVTAEPAQISLAPGKEMTVTLHVQRQNGFKGRVPCYVQNLPPGMRVVNVGLNGVLVTENQDTQTFTLRAEDWAKRIQQPIYVVAEVESNSPTMHASLPLMLNVTGNKETAGASQGQDERNQKPGSAPDL